MPFKIVRNDIVKMNTDAIVNPSNSKVTVGNGCDLAVYNAAGYDLLLAERAKIGPMQEGEAALTKGFRLPAKYIIHAVSPAYIDGSHGEEEKLRSCYKNSLKIARENHINSIAFPLLSTGSFGYPKEEGLRIALDEINAFLLENDMMVFLVVFDRKSTELGEKVYPDLEAYIDYNYVCDRREEEYGDRNYGSAARPSFTQRLFQNRFSAKKDGSNERPGRKPTASRPDIPIQEEKSAVSFNQAPFHCLESTSLKEDECELDASPFDYDDQNCLDELDRKLKERMSHMKDSFSDYLLYLIDSKGMENAEVYNRAIVDRKVFSKIKNNADYHPKKVTALCLCIGAKLNLDESKDLLARAGYALSPCDKQDIIFSYFIENKIYDMIELDLQLEEHGLPPIIE